MRNLKNNFIPLMVLAQHLECGDLKENYEKLHFYYSDDRKFLLIGKGERYHMVVPQVIFELPHLFGAFKRTASGDVYYAVAPDVQINYAVLEFFGLTIKEYLHLFCIDRQNCEEFGGSSITLDYTTKQLAENIIEFLDRVLEMEKNKSSQRLYDAK